MFKISVRMKILLISNNFPNSQEPTRGIFTFQLASAMKQLGDITVISPLPWFPSWNFLKRFPGWYKFSQVPSAGEVEGLRVYYPKYFMIPKISGAFQSLLVFLSIFSLARRLFQESMFDIINVHWVYPDGVAASWMAKILKVPILISALGCDINRYGQVFNRRIQIVPALRSAKRITAVSVALKENICRLGIPDSKVVVIPNGINFKKFHPKAKEVARRALELKIENGEKIILFVGQLVEVKGLVYLIEAFGLLKKTTALRFKALLVGEGPLRRHLECQVIHLGLEGNVSFQGPKPHEEIAVWMGACDLLTLPSIREGQPNVVLEALACGRPVVATAVGGLPDLVSEKKGNGILCPSSSSPALAGALSRALNKTYSPDLIVETVRGMTWESSAQIYYREMEAILNR